MAYLNGADLIGHYFYKKASFRNNSTSHNIKQDFFDVNNIKTKSYINFYNPDYMYAEIDNR